MNKNDKTYVAQQVGTMALKFAETITGISKYIKHADDSIDLLKNIQDKRLAYLEERIDTLHLLIEAYQSMNEDDLK